MPFIYMTTSLSVMQISKLYTSLLIFEILDTGLQENGLLCYFIFLRNNIASYEFSMHIALIFAMLYRT